MPPELGLVQGLVDQRRQERQSRVARRVHAPVRARPFVDGGRLEHLVPVTLTVEQGTRAASILRLDALPWLDISLAAELPGEERHGLRRVRHRRLKLHGSNAMRDVTVAALGRVQAWVTVLA